MKRLALVFFFLLIVLASQAQSFRVYGKVTTDKMEPLPFASIVVKESGAGATSKEDGSYQLNLEVGRYNLEVSIVGYKTQILNIVVTRDLEQNLVMEEDARNTMEDIVIRVKAKDRAEEFMRNVIRNKESIMDASGAYSVKLYIKAVQQDSVYRKKDHKTSADPFMDPDGDFEGMDMSEVVLKLDKASEERFREERLGVRYHGDQKDFFYLSTTQGNFNFYNNLVKVPEISTIPFLSPVSYSGLMAYKFKTVKRERVNGRMHYTISVKPRQLSNATVEGELVISDSSWVILHSRFTFPSYHLPEYDFFEVVQDYGFVDNKAWMLTRQQFNYFTKTNKQKILGNTLVLYSDYELNKAFPRNYFGVELSATAQKAYEQDSSFWKTVRTHPLTDKEVRYVRYRDSIFEVTHSPAYLDSLDRENNRITWKKLLITGQTFYKRSSERTWVMPPLIAMYEPFQFGGGRIHPKFYYYKKYRSRKDIKVIADVSYGIRNSDINGSLYLKRMYNPFNRGFYIVDVTRDFDQIYKGDAWINQINRSSYFLNNYLAVGQGLEILNGLNIYTEIDYALRRSVAGYKINPRADSIFGDFLDNNKPIAFEPYDGAYTKVTLSYTPKQRYIREPKEKIILGSKWPTFYATWRKGLPGILGSNVDFDFVEFGMEQSINFGILGNLRYNIKSGDFLNNRNIGFLDSNFIRRGDPFLFMNPDEAFQAMDSTFPVYKRTYQGHFIHEFNGALINKIPFMKKLQLREIAGAGFLVAPEVDLRYVEFFAGIERVFKWPLNPLTKFKVGAYIVTSAANKFANPVQFKVGLTTWDLRRNKWR